MAWGKSLNHPGLTRKAGFSYRLIPIVNCMTTQPAPSSESDIATPRLPGKGGMVLRVFLAVALMVACAFSPLLILKPVGALFRSLPAKPGISSDLLEILFGTVAYALATVCALLLCRLLVRHLDRRSPQVLALKVSRRALVWLGAMVLLTFVVVLLSGLMTDLLGVARVTPSWGQNTWWKAIAVELVLGFLLQGIPEEVVWRGWLFQSLGGGRSAAVVSVLGFTVMHLVSQGGQQGWVEHLLYLTPPLGFATAAMAARWVSGSTWAAVGVHGGFHISDLLGKAMGLPVDDPISWVITGCVWLVAAAAIVLFGRRTTNRQPA